ncbi:hypothetical protein AOQ84DRAFT_366618 [Glonium stellatum]|uniref:BZIP domain-containing protein n=1 Tax=Glonium stellatum TaxID=574774 RepID=A0A8E2JQA5_9PEZI|nr:hypothetical protein AOQ84DRAFT_366618 [Glonium stellatum]
MSSDMTVEFQMFMANVEKNNELDSPSQNPVSPSSKLNKPDLAAQLRKERYRNDSGYLGSCPSSPKAQRLDGNSEYQSVWRLSNASLVEPILSHSVDWQNIADAATSTADSPRLRRSRSAMSWEEKKLSPTMDERSPQSDGSVSNIEANWRNDYLNEDAGFRPNHYDQLDIREQPSHPQCAQFSSSGFIWQSRSSAPSNGPKPTELPSKSRSSQSFQYEQSRTPESVPDTLGDIEQQSPRPDPLTDEIRNPSIAGKRNSTRKMNRKRKGDEDTDEDDEAQRAKREKDLERNRLAASKCRAKKKEETRQTEEKARRLQAENAHLRAWVGQLQEEKLQLMDQILSLSNTSDSRIRGFLNQRAYNLVQPSSSMPQGSPEQSSAYSVDECDLPASDAFHLSTGPAHSRSNSAASTQYFNHGSYQQDMQRVPRQSVDSGFGDLSLNSPTQTRANSMAGVHTTQQSPTGTIFGASQMGPHALSVSGPSAISIGNNQMRPPLRKDQQVAQNVTQYAPQYTGLSGLPEVPQSSDPYAEALANRLQDALRSQEHDQGPHSS